jgi:hypothetical protein
VYQQNSPIYDGRYDAKKPIDTTAPPIQLFHPVFGHFLDDLSNDLPVPPEIAKATIGYMRASSAIYGLRLHILTIEYLNFVCLPE